MAAVDVYLEVTPKKVFAVAPQWPGWCRSGRDREAALAALSAYAPRYQAVARAAGVKAPLKPDLKVVATVAGDASTTFGVPGRLGPGDLEPITTRRRERDLALLRGSWDVLDEVVANSPAELRKGPRGGGRDRDKMIAHVLDAETGYARYIGLKLKPPAAGDRGAVRAHRRQILDALATAPQVASVEGRRHWPFTYIVRRMAWHALDHAWEMEDRREP